MSEIHVLVQDLNSQTVEVNTSLSQTVNIDTYYPDLNPYFLKNQTGDLVNQVSGILVSYS